MRFGVAGLGRMGSNLALQALEKGHEVVGYDPDKAAREAAKTHGVRSASSLQELVSMLKAPRIVLVYVPHGDPTEQVISELKALLSSGDVVVDGGNSHWADAQRRHGELKQAGVAFLDAGTSGGLDGARHGACFMVGGDAEAFAVVKPLLSALAVPEGLLHAGPAGAGHFTKLVHNAIEFGMLQALGEGLDLLVGSDFVPDPAAVFHNWVHGSVIRGWLVELMARGLQEQKLEELSSYVEDTREVRWIVEYALRKEAWIPVIAQSELALYKYRDQENVAATYPAA